MGALWIARFSIQRTLHCPPGLAIVAFLFSLLVLSSEAQFGPSRPTPFVVRSYLSSNYPGSSYPGKCLEFGAVSRGASPTVFISDCNGSASQRFDVEDVATSLKKAESLGGKMLVPPVEIPAGTFAWFQDPDGNTVGLWKAKT